MIDENGYTVPEVVRSMRSKGLNVTEQEVQEEFDKMVQEGIMFRDPHGRYYGSEHPVVKAYKRTD